MKQAYREPIKKGRVRCLGFYGLRITREQENLKRTMTKEEKRDTSHQRVLFNRNISGRGVIIAIRSRAGIRIRKTNYKSLERVCWR